MTKEPKELQAPRDYKAEAKAKRLRAKEKMALVARARNEATRRELLQVAQVFCFCGLSYRRTEERTIKRSARVPNGDTVRVTFQAMAEGVDLPFGTDRSLMHWMTHRAVTTKNRFIPLSSASEFLRDMGMADSGQNIQRTREAFQRIASFAINIQRVSGGAKDQIIKPIIGRSRMPASMFSPDHEGLVLLEEPDDPRNGFLLDEDVFSDFIQWHVPTLQTFIRQTRETPQLQDYMLFLQWRSHIAKTETLIPWNMLREQLWSEDARATRIREKFHEAVTTLKLAWPGLNAQAVSAGLKIGPSREPFLLEAALSASAPKEKAQLSLALPEPPPSTPSAGEAPAEAAQAAAGKRPRMGPEALAAARRVMAACGLSDAKLAPVIAAALIARTTRHEGTTLAQAEASAISNRNYFVEVGDLLTFKVGPEKFFSQGWVWDWNLWPYDQKEIARRQRTRIGSY